MGTVFGYGSRRGPRASEPREFRALGATTRRCFPRRAVGRSTVPIATRGTTGRRTRAVTVRSHQYHAFPDGPAARQPASRTARPPPEHGLIKDDHHGIARIGPVPRLTAKLAHTASPVPAVPPIPGFRSSSPSAVYCARSAGDARVARAPAADASSRAPIRPPVSDLRDQPRPEVRLRRARPPRAAAKSVRLQINQRKTSVTVTTGPGAPPRSSKHRDDE